MTVLIFIPARGGSKGIPRKNMARVKGKPLIEYTLKSCFELIENKEYDWVPFVSTDDEEIAQYCAGRGIDIAYRRPARLSSDQSNVIDAINDAVTWLGVVKNLIVDAVLLLQPTTPIRNTREILSAIDAVHGEEYFSLVSVMRMREHPNECMILDGSNWSFLVPPQPDHIRRQDYEQKYFFLDGSFYFASISFIELNNSFVVPGHTKLFPVIGRWPIDIDEADDIRVAEAFL